MSTATALEQGGDGLPSPFMAKVGQPVTTVEEAPLAITA